MAMENLSQQLNSDNNKYRLEKLKTKKIMERKFTVLKAASVMLTAIILGTGCQKTLETKEEVSKSSSVSSQYGEMRSYALRTMEGKEVGTFIIADDHGKASVEVSMDGQMAKNA